jgi:Mu transposase-like protein
VPRREQVQPQKGAGAAVPAAELLQTTDLRRPRVLLETRLIVKTGAQAAHQRRERVEHDQQSVTIPTRGAGDLFAGWWQLISALGAVPRLLVWDGEGAGGRWRAGRVELTAECQAFRGTLATKVIVLKPREPEHKGIIERAHDYLERSFLPGRSFSSPADFNTQLQQWLQLVNARPRRALGCAPTDRITADRQAMLALPPVPPVTGWRNSLRLPRDHYVRVDANDYSVHPAVIGRRIEVIANLARVQAATEPR